MVTLDSALRGGGNDVIEFLQIFVASFENFNRKLKWRTVTFSTALIRTELVGVAVENQPRRTSFESV